MVGPVEETLAPCPECKKVNPQDAKFCCGCGHKLKRGWTVVGGGTAPSRTIDSESDASVPQGPRRMYDKSRGSQAERTKTEQALDKLSEAEKKALEKALQEDDEDSTWRALENNRPYRASSGSLPRPEASHAAGSDQLPVAPKAQMPLPPRDLLRPPSRKDEEGRDKAQGVRQREMSEFKQALYDHSYNGRRCVPSTASPIPTELQATCPHRLEDLLWTSNEHGHYARCKRCDLKNVLYYSQRHGVLVTHVLPLEKEILKASSSSTTSTNMEMPVVIADTGCRNAVAGEAWHERCQIFLKEKGITWQQAPERETYQFGSGAPEISQVAYLYPVFLEGSYDVVRISCVGGGAVNCPGLIGPSELSRWGVIFNFEDRSIQIRSCTKPM